MSRMTKYLKQTCTVKNVLIDADGEPLVDIYGEPSYSVPAVYKCRRERSFKDVLTVSGVMKKSSITYYLDETCNINIGDLIDDRAVVDFQEYTNEHGQTEGYMVVT